MTSSTDPRVAAYLRQLDHALSPLPWEQRHELFTDISAHIDSELAARPADRRAVDDVLSRLGDPQVIAAAAGAPPPPPPARGRAMEIAAVVLVAIGGFVIPFIGWVIGIALLWASRRFTPRDKLIGTLVPPLGFFAPILLAFVAGTSASSVQVCATSAGGAAPALAARCSVTTGGGSGAGWLVAVAVLAAAALYTVVRLSRRVARMT